jgi:hypothetical protein
VGRFGVSVRAETPAAILGVEQPHREAVGVVETSPTIYH